MCAYKVAGACRGSWVIPEAFGTRIIYFMIALEVAWQNTLKAILNDQNTVMLVMHFISKVNYLLPIYQSLEACARFLHFEPVYFHY